MGDFEHLVLITGTMVFVEPLANPFLAVGLRVALGAYVVFMARKFYADPMGYFRRVARNSPGLLPDHPQVRQMVRGLACFCVWGGCFIIASAIAAELLNLHGWGYAGLLVALAATATYLLLPEDPDSRAPETEPKVTDRDEVGRLK